MIQWIHVTHRYKNGTIALEDINLQIPDGQFLFLMGASGAGKSTFTRILLREYKATDGSVVVNGTNLKKLRGRKLALYRRQIGFVYQDYRLLSDRTAYENIAFSSECLGLSTRVVRQRAEQALEYVGLRERAKHYPHELSGGEQQRIAIARAIANEPRILIADEPTGNLDADTAQEIMGIFERIHQSGTTLIMATHNEALPKQYGDRLVRLESGRMVEDSLREVGV